MDWSTKAMLQETLRCLQKTETDLGVNLDGVRKHVRVGRASCRERV